MIAELVGMGGLLLLLLTPRQRMPRQSRQRPAYTERGNDRGASGSSRDDSFMASRPRSAYAVAFWLIGVFRRKGVTL